MNEEKVKPISNMGAFSWKLREKASSVQGFEKEIEDNAGFLEWGSVKWYKLLILWLHQLILQVYSFSIISDVYVLEVKGNRESNRPKRKPTNIFFKLLQPKNSFGALCERYYTNLWSSSHIFLGYVSTEKSIISFARIEDRRSCTTNNLPVWKTYWRRNLLSISS